MKNHFTRTITLWLANDEGTYRYWNEAAEQEYESQDPDDRGETRRRNARYDLARRLKNEIDVPEGMDPMFADLLTSALQEVDWDEVADDLLSGVDGVDDDADEPATVDAEPGE